MVGVDGAGKTNEECCALVVVTEDVFVKLLEAKVDGSKLCKVEYVGVLGPERYDYWPGFVEAWDKET